jgi:type VI secretion system protein ImpC
MSPEKVSVAARADGGVGAAQVVDQVVLRALLLADLAPGYQGPPIDVDRTRFAETLLGLSPKLELTVPDRLGSGAKELSCTLKFADLKAFHPDSVARSVPLLAGLLEARAALAACIAGELDAAALLDRVPAAFAATSLGAAVRQAVAGARPAATPSQPGTTPGAATGGGVDALLSMVDVPDGTPRPQPAALLDMLLATLLPPAGRPVDKKELAAVLAEVDARLTRQVAAICDAKPLRELEAAWRGLKALVDRVDFRKPVRLEVLPASRQDVLDVFYDNMFQAEHEGTSEVPLSLVVADVAVDRGLPDLDMVEAMGRMGSSLGVPFVAAVAPEFFGVKQPALVASMPDLAKKVRGTEYAKWNRFRGDEASLWVALAANRVLLRDSWGEPSAEVHAFAWDRAAVGQGNQPLFGSGAIALATAVLQAYADSGLKLPISGFGSPGALANLPLRLVKVGKTEPVAFPLEVMLGDNRTLDLAQSGFAPLLARAGEDTACFPAAPTFHQPARYDQEEATRASFRAATLAYQLFAGMAAHALDGLARRVGGASQVDIMQKVQDGLLAFLGTAGEPAKPEEVTVEITVNQENPHLLDVAVRLRPSFPLGGGPADLMLGTQVLSQG